MFSAELTDQAGIAREIHNLPMPQRVDLLLYKTVTNSKLRAHIRRHGVEWFRRAGKQKAISDKTAQKKGI